MHRAQRSIKAAIGLAIIGALSGCAGTPLVYVRDGASYSQTQRDRMECNGSSSTPFGFKDCMTGKGYEFLGAPTW